MRCRFRIPYLGSHRKSIMILQQFSNQELIDNIGVIVLGLDKQGRINLVNRAGSEFLGYPSEELIGMDWFGHFFLPEDRQSVQDVFSLVMAGKMEKPAYHEEIIVIRNGERCMIGWHNTVLKESDGTITGILASGEDITGWKQAQEELSRSEERFRLFVDDISDGLFIYDVQGQFVDVNRQACLSLGYSREELLTLGVADIDPDFPRDRVAIAIKQILEGKGPTLLQGTHQHKDGHCLPVEVKVDVLDQEDSPLFIAVARDISKRLRQERRLQDSRGLLRTIIDSIPDIICIKNGKGEWLLANDFNLQLFQLQDVDYRGKTDKELALFSPFYEQAFLTCMSSDEVPWKTGKPLREDEYISRTDGSECIFDVYKVPLFHEDGRRKALIVIGRDITEKKHVEDTYKNLFEQSPLPYLSLSAGGIIQVVNQAFLDTFGYRREELEDKYLPEFMTQASRDLFVENYPRFVQGKSFSDSDYEIYRADGSVAVVQVTGTVIRNASMEPVSAQCIVTDVTRQRQVEEKIRESEERYRLLFERSPVGVLNFDTELRITDCNDRFARIIGCTRERLLGLDMKTLDDTRILPAMKEALNGKEGRREGEYQAATHSGKIVYASMRTAPLYNSHGEIQGGIAIVEDITRQKQTEVEKDRLMSAIEQASEAIVITDIKPEIEYVNPAFEYQTGYSFEEVRGRNPRVLQSGQHDAAFYKAMWQTLVRGQVWRGHVINKRKDGSLFEEDATISPVRNREGMIINYVAVKRDISREVNLEKQLTQAMKMEAIGTLAGGIAHDFNNILSAVLGYAEMVDLQVAEDDPVKQDVAQIIAAGNRAAELVRQILTFSRQEEEDLRPVKLQLVIKEALKLLRSSLPTTIELQQEIDAGCGSVLADPTRIHQVLMNLCTNAKQAMGAENGVLRVTLDEIQIDSTSPISLHPVIDQGRWLDLEVSDTGPGIESDIREKIFDPFFTTKEKGQGTGLGLSVTHGIVKSHGGEITVSCIPGQGTTFHVYLPVIDSERGEAVQNNHVYLSRGNERVLIVDDESMLVNIMERTLAALGYTVISFTDSKAALQEFQDRADEIDLIITDMTMPHYTGAELAKAVLAIRPQMPIILCTGYSEYFGEDQAKGIGIREFVTKPVGKKTLAHIVRNVLDETLNLVESK